MNRRNFLYQVGKAVAIPFVLFHTRNSKVQPPASVRPRPIALRFPPEPLWVLATIGPKGTWDTWEEAQRKGCGLGTRDLIAADAKITAFVPQNSKLRIEGWKLRPQNFIHIIGYDPTRNNGQPPWAMARVKTGRALLVEGIG